MVEINNEEFKKKFPYLFKEFGQGEANISFKELLDSKEEKKDLFRGHSPTVIDYLRRCDTKKQAEKTIKYLIKKGEVEESYGNDLLKQLNEKGFRSFGPKKEDDYYLKNY